MTNRLQDLGINDDVFRGLYTMINLQFVVQVCLKLFATLIWYIDISNVVPICFCKECFKVIINELLFIQYVVVPGGCDGHELPEIKNGRKIIYEELTYRGSVRP